MAVACSNGLEAREFWCACMSVATAGCCHLRFCQWQPATAGSSAC